MIWRKGTALSSMLALTLLLALPQLASSVGTCRDVSGCGAPESKCDPNLTSKLEEARAKFKQLLGRAKVFFASESDRVKLINGETEEEDKIFNDLVKDLIKELVINEGIYKRIPSELATYDKIMNILQSDSESTEKLLKLSKMLVVEGSKGVSTDVPEIAKVANLMEVVGLADAKLYVMAQHQGDDSKAAERDAAEALAALQKAQDVLDLIRKLEAQCEKAGTKSPPPDPEEEEFKTSGERQQEAAQRLKDSWKEVYGGFIDAGGGFHDADEALQDAQEILLNQQESSVIGLVRVARIVDETRQDRGLVAATQRKLNSDERTRFEKLLTRGLEGQIKGLETLNRTTLEVRKIHERNSS